MTVQEGHTDLLQVLVQAKADFDKATTNDGATPALAVAWKRRTQELVHVFGNVELNCTRASSTQILVRTGIILHQRSNSTFATHPSSVGRLAR